MPKQNRVNVSFSRRYDAKSRNGRLWTWIKRSFPDSSWGEPLTELIHAFFGALKDGTSEDVAVKEFRALLKEWGAVGRGEVVAPVSTPDIQPVVHAPVKSEAVAQSGFFGDVEDDD